VIGALLRWRDPACVRVRNDTPSLRILKRSWENQLVVGGMFSGTASEDPAERDRDRDTDRRLCESGWISVRVREHEDPIQAAGRIAEIVSQRLTRAPRI
jgi:hypothetical protein